MHRSEQMDPSILWLLFMMTLLVHVFTFFILQVIADKFSIYIVRPDITLANGINETGESSRIKQKLKVPNEKSEQHFTGLENPIKASDSKMGTLRVNDYNRGQYQELHETLDVSVFR